MKPTRTRSRTIAAASVLALVGLASANISAANAEPAGKTDKLGQDAVELTRTTLWSEDFESVKTPTGFARDAPEDWSIRNSEFSTGEERWAGWAFTNVRDWTWAVGTEQRHYFTRGHGTFAVAESRHQRLAEHDRMTTALQSPQIDVKKQDAVELRFDSHYRQGAALQHATVSVSFDGGPAQELSRYTADKMSSHELLSVDVPDGARTASFSWSYNDSQNDWFWAIDNVEVTEPMGKVEGEAYAVVDVISDIQGAIPQYKSAVAQLNEMQDPAGAMVVNGDYVDLGSEALYDEFEAATNEVPHDSGRTYFTIGNHEMLGAEGSETYIDRYLEFTGQDKVWREEVVDGVPIILVNTEYYSDADRGGVEPYVKISDEQLGWLDTRLAYWAKQGKPALVFNHHVLPDTVSSSYSAWNQHDYYDLESFAEVVGKYSNVVFFTSHTHMSLELEDWWGRYRAVGTDNALGFPVVNTGAITYNTVPDGSDHEGDRLEGDHSTGLRVKVYEDRVRVEAWDFVRGEMIKHVDLPTPKKTRD
ncbi:metallophosphoesterase [Salinibacterium sp. ZJ454]|uniref:metallophosphoesterase family protein n=1 Tax=Salinibacterium sp. ZJ454 TaxID=2708339 RepID=UPI00141DB9CA|nr:metallophosphoesterase [Salinibacterium sp. ZJ454]